MSTLSNPPSKPPSRRGSFVGGAPLSPNHRASRTNSPREEELEPPAVTSPNPVVRGGKPVPQQQSPEKEVEAKPQEAKNTDGESDMFRNVKTAEPLFAPNREASVRNDTRADRLSSTPPPPPASHAAPQPTNVSRVTTQPPATSSPPPAFSTAPTAPTPSTVAASSSAPSPVRHTTVTSAPTSGSSGVPEPLSGPGRRRPSDLPSPAPSVRPALSAISGLERVAAIPKLQGSSGRIQERVGTCIYNLMAVKCPERLSTYPEIMRQYEGKEEQLLDAIQAVFGDEYFFGRRPNVGYITGAAPLNDGASTSTSAARRRSQSPHTTDFLIDAQQSSTRISNQGSIPRAFDRSIGFGNSIPYPTQHGLQPAPSIPRTAQSVASVRSSSIMTPPLPKDMGYATASLINANYGVASRTTSTSTYGK